MGDSGCFLDVYKLLEFYDSLLVYWSEPFKLLDLMFLCWIRSSWERERERERERESWNSTISALQDKKECMVAFSLFFFEFQREDSLIMHIEIC